MSHSSVALATDLRRRTDAAEVEWVFLLKPEPVSEYVLVLPQVAMMRKQLTAKLTSSFTAPPLSSQLRQGQHD